MPTVLATLMTRLDVPDPVTLDWLKLKANPVVPLADNKTVPANPFSAVIVVVELWELPAMTLTGDMALILKSGG